MSGIFENSGMRRLFAAFAAVAAAFLLFVALFCNIFINRMETSIAEREYSAAGRLVNTGKLNEDDVITAFTAGNDANSIESGENVLKSAGYNTDTADFLMPFLQSNLNMFSFSMMIAAVLLVLILVLYCFFAFRNIYEKIDGLAKHAGRIGRRIYNIKLDDNFEGAVARVYHAFNEMQSTIKADFEKLEHDRVFLKNLISDISHQLKTPLSSLKMYNEIILQEDLSETALEFTKKSNEQLERMQWLILGLLKMARIETGSYDMQIKENNLNSIVTASINDFELTLSNKNIDVNLEGDKNVKLKCDASWLKEAIGNIIKNCMEYTPNGGRITVKIEQNPVMVTVKISDTGSGIHPDDLPFIFRRFYRGRGSHTAGSGIGLSLAKSIAEQMGGTLSAGGTYGSGAEFTFSFLKKVI